MDLKTNGFQYIENGAKDDENERTGTSIHTQKIQNLHRLFKNEKIYMIAYLQRQFIHLLLLRILFDFFVKEMHFFAIHNH